MVPARFHHSGNDHAFPSLTKKACERSVRHAADDETGRITLHRDVAVRCATFVRALRGYSVPAGLRAGSAPRSGRGKSSLWRLPAEIPPELIFLCQGGRILRRSYRGGMHAGG